MGDYIKIEKRELIHSICHFVGLIAPVILGVFIMVIGTGAIPCDTVIEIKIHLVMMSVIAGGIFFLIGVLFSMSISLDFFRENYKEVKNVRKK